MNRFRRLVRRPGPRVSGAPINGLISTKAGRIGLAGAAALALGLGVAACGGDDSSGGSSGEVNLVAYSTPESAYDGALIPGFEKTSEGDGATFKNSFGPSGDQQRAVIAGQPADYVHFSLEPDMQALVDAGLVDSSWARTTSTRGSSRTRSSCSRSAREIRRTSRPGMTWSGPALRS